MAGRDPTFDAREFRQAIRGVYRMALAPDEERQPIFHFPKMVTSTNALDSDDVPFDPTQTPPAAPAKSPVKVPCAIRYVDDQGDPTGLGVITPSRVELTFLDTDYAQVEGFSHVVIDGDVYRYRRTQPPTGLFDVGMFAVICVAEDES